MASGSPAVDTPGPSQEGTAPDKRHTSAHQRPGPRTQTRQQRAAMISDEVRTIARGTTEVKSNGAFRSIEGGGNPTKEVSPQAKGQNVTGGAMGDNAAPGREGPNAQGVQQVVSSDVEGHNTIERLVGKHTSLQKVVIASSVHLDKKVLYQQKKPWSLEYDEITQRPRRPQYLQESLAHRQGQHVSTGTR